jgi:hypothetical protein
MTRQRVVVFQILLAVVVAGALSAGKMPIFPKAVKPYLTNHNKMYIHMLWRRI